MLVVDEVVHVVVEVFVPCRKATTFIDALRQTKSERSADAKHAADGEDRLGRL